MKNFVRASLLVFILAASLRVSAESKSIDLGIECNSSTSAQERMLIKSNSPVVGQRGEICIEKNNKETNLKYLKISLTYNKIADVYTLNIILPESDSKELKQFSRRNLHRNLLIIKGNAFIVSAEVESILDKSIISIGVPDQASGHLLGNAINGGAGVKH